jgi:iron complex transport system ATP-binding protein
MRINHLTFGYGKVPVFHDMCLSFEKSLNIIVGPNAAGKSTLLKCVFGLLPAQGQIAWQGTDLSRMSREERLNLMVYLPQQEISDTALTVFEAVLLGRLDSLCWKVSDTDLEKVMGALRTLRIEVLAERYVNELSGGQRKLVSIAQTLVRDPKIVLMDEPTNSLDLQKQLELFTTIRQIIAYKKIMFVVVMHDLNLSCRYADQLTVLDGSGGIYASGPPREVVTDKMLRDVYGVDAQIMHDESGVPVVAPICSVQQINIS